MLGMLCVFLSSGLALDLQVSLGCNLYGVALTHPRRLPDSLQRETVLTIRGDIVKSVQAGLSKCVELLMIDNV